MTLPAALFVIRWLVRDTFRQARASGVFWLMLGVSLVCFVVCLSVSVSDLPTRAEAPELLPPAVLEQLPPEQRQDRSVTAIQGRFSLFFGAVSVEWNRHRESAVRYVQWVLLGLIADTGGILLALIWTAGFLPAFLDSSTASVLLAKPLSRWSLLAGKFLGVLFFVAFQAVIFVFLVWLGLGLRTQVWDARCLLAVPVLLLHFATFFSMSALLAVATRSTVACVFGSVLFWFVCLGMNLGRHAAVTLPEFQTLSPLFSGLVELGYWVLPRPADLAVVLVDALGASGEFTQMFDVKAVQNAGAWHPELSVLACLVFVGVTLALSAWELHTRDY